MATINVMSTRTAGFESVECLPMNCPTCGAYIMPSYLAIHNHCFLFAQCPIYNCGALFLLERKGNVLNIIPNHKLASEHFSDTIKSISNEFISIYNEAYAAEQMSLNEICGAGYRKALEFLVKDYVSEGKTAEEIQIIRKKRLSNCIDDYVDDYRIKEVAKRAVWIGNDETHYVRKWEGKDVQDLKGLIRLVIRWIEQIKDSESILLDMPEGK